MRVFFSTGLPVCSPDTGNICVKTNNFSSDLQFVISPPYLFRQRGSPGGIHRDGSTSKFQGVTVIITIKPQNEWTFPVAMQRTSTCTMLVDAKASHIPCSPSEPTMEDGLGCWWHDHHPKPRAEPRVRDKPNRDAFLLIFPAACSIPEAQAERPQVQCSAGCPRQRRYCSG